MPWNSVDEKQRKSLEKQLAAHERANPVPEILTMQGDVVPEGTPVGDLVIPGAVAELKVHPDMEDMARELEQDPTRVPVSAAPVV